MRFRTFLFSIVPLAVAAGPAFAGQVTALFNGIDEGFGVNATYTYYTSAGGPGTAQTTIGTTAGRFKWTGTTTSGTMLASYGDPFYTFCIDLIQHINSFNSYTFTEDLNLATLPTGNSPPQYAIPMGTTGATNLKKLFDYAWDDVKDGAAASIANYNGLGFAATLAERAAAFQLAVWEVVQEGAGAYSLGAGKFSATVTGGTVTNQSHVASIAADFLTGLFGETGDTVLGLATTTNQDQALLVKLNSETVPLPGSLAAFAPILMLGGSVWKSKRRRQRAEDSAVA